MSLKALTDDELLDDIRSMEQALVQYKAERNRRGFSFDVSDPRHGTLNGYNNLKCRCGRCKRANADYQTEYWRRRLVNDAIAEAQAVRDAS